MYSSERILTAIGEISDERIEKAALALGYVNHSRSASHARAGVRRLMLIAAVITIILALCVSAYAIYVHWSRGMERMLPATEQEKQMAEESGLSDSSKSVSATAGGVTVSVEQTVIDGDTAWIALRIEGFKLNRDQGWDAAVWNCSLTFDGEKPPAWGASFAGEHDENGNLIISTLDGSMEYDIWARAGDKLQTLAGREIRITIESMGIGGLKTGEYLPLVEGPWELVWSPSSNSEKISVQPDTVITETDVRLISAEIGPITAKVTMKLPQLWEGFETLDLYDLQLTGVRLQDGTVVLNIFGPPSYCGYEDINDLIFVQEYSSHKIIRPEQVDALIFARDFPWARSLTEDELIILPIS